jgi:collagenase-like PrtC family protease
MANLEFSVPYCNDLETLEAVFRLKSVGNNRIREVYLSGPQEYSGSGRELPKMNMDEFIGIVDKIHNEGIRVNLLLNSTCEGSNWYSPEVLDAVMGYLEQVHKEHGVEAVTIANPIYIKQVRRLLPDIEICASVLSDIDCVQRAVLYNRAGANVITPDVNINRDLKLLKEIKEATNAELKLMVNEGCLYKCPFRKFHFNLTSHKSKELTYAGTKRGVFLAHCLEVTAMDPSQILKSGWIRPEDTRKYSEITSYFKVVGREQRKSKAIRATKAYLEESWDGGLLDLLCASLNNFNLEYGAYLDNKSLGEYKFFEKVTSCDKNCHQCSYCEELGKKLIEFDVFTQEELTDIINDYIKI